MRFAPLSLSVLCTLIAAAAVQAQEAKKADDAPALARFVGSWKSEVWDKPSKSSPDGGKRTDIEYTSRFLKDRFVLGRQVSQPDNTKSLWLITYDPNSKTYPLWFFNSRGVQGGEWAGTWDEKTSTLTSQATDTPKGWTSSGTNVFAEKNSYQSSFWMKDDSGNVVFDSEAKKTRQPDSTGTDMLKAWSKLDKPAQSAPDEMNVLEQILGSWDTVSVAKPAVWTPKEIRSTSKVTRKMVLDGHFLQDTSEIDDGQEGFSMVSFDPRMKKYRIWWFSSEGLANFSGDWDAVLKTVSFVSEPREGRVARGSLRVLNKDHHVWKVDIKDGDGKLYFDGEWTVTRRKE